MRKIIQLITWFSFIAIPISLYSAPLLDLNKATAPELMKLSGVGEKSAKLIVQYRLYETL